VKKECYQNRIAPNMALRSLSEICPSRLGWKRRKNKSEKIENLGANIEWQISLNGGTR